jgi:serine phosphatase RsbU (regulator of sigma subunit)
MPPTFPAPLTAGTALRLLLVEDDEGDAFLVSELLREEEAPFDLLRVRTLAEALELLDAEPVDCVLLDLGLPDASGLGALQRLREAVPDVAHLVLTGDRDVQRGVEAVAAGAQDYLVKGSVDGDGLRRAVLYAVERRQADDVRQQLRGAKLLAEEARRLERGLLPKPILHDERLGVGTGYRPGRQRTLLGGDFYDAVELPDGRVHLLIGDVSGHGPDEAALGVCLRVAWRTQTLGDAGIDGILPTLQRVLVHERLHDEVFATVLTVCVEPDRSGATLRSAGHQPPLLLRADGPPEIHAVAPGLPLGILDDARWPAVGVELPAHWGLLLSTDGLVEGRAGPDRDERLAMDGLLALITEADGRWAEDPDAVIATLIEEVLRRNGEAPLDDVAALLLTGTRGGRRP